MGGETRLKNAVSMRCHDYLYDPAFIVSGARDYARSAFKAAMASSQMVIQPVYKAMFSEIVKAPRMHVVYHVNCRLPSHMDRSYEAYLHKVDNSFNNLPTPDFSGKDRFKFSATPKKVLSLHTTSPEFHPPTPDHNALKDKPRNKGTQSMYRESSAQTTPWQPDGKKADECDNTPEVMFLQNFEWGPGKPYRLGDLPADFHTTEIINKMRHARKWMSLVDRSSLPGWVKRRDAIINDVETKDWIFREAEIDELQDIRLNLLHKLQKEQREKQNKRTGKKLSKLWATKKSDMERKIDHIRRTRDRELRKLSINHDLGGKPGMVEKLRSMRGGGSVAAAATDFTTDMYAPRPRHGYQARNKHKEITYDPSLLSFEDHQRIAAPPAWLHSCGQDLTKTCSGHHLSADPTKLCERETKWSEEFLENLHKDLIKARLGAGVSAGPLRVLQPRVRAATPRPATPQVEAVPDDTETSHQAALVLQRIVRGRAVQNLMYEGRTRAAELTLELKTTHGLQKEDKIRIAKEEAKAIDHNCRTTEAEKKEDAICGLVDELCGGAVSAALDFLEKELRRLKEERRQHAFILIALREKTMREAAEAGRRQKEEHRRREHDEMFKQVLGVTQETVDVYFRDIVEEGVELAAEEDAVAMVTSKADKIDESMLEHGSMSSAEQNELVAELVQQFLLPNAHRTAARFRISELQRASLEAARGTIFGLVDEAEIRKVTCIRCGVPLGEPCACNVCPISLAPTETVHREDPRWKHTRRRDPPRELSPSERLPAQFDFRCMLDYLVDEAVTESRRVKKVTEEIRFECIQKIKEKVEIELDAAEMLQQMVELATGAIEPPIKRPDYYHTMIRMIDNALGRTLPPDTCTCPKELPSEKRRREEEERKRREKPDTRCYCVEEPKSKVKFIKEEVNVTPEERDLLPSALRSLEELRKCKCDVTPAPSLADSSSAFVSDDLVSYYTDTTVPTPVPEDDVPQVKEELE